MKVKCDNCVGNDFDSDELGATQLSIVRNELVSSDDRPGQEVEKLTKIVNLCPMCFIKSGLQFYNGDIVNLRRNATQEDLTKEKEFFEFEQAALKDGKYGEF